MAEKIRLQVLKSKAVIIDGVIYIEGSFMLRKGGLEAVDLKEVCYSTTFPTGLPNEIRIRLYTLQGKVLADNSGFGYVEIILQVETEFGEKLVGSRTADYELFKQCSGFFEYKVKTGVSSISATCRKASESFNAFGKAVSGVKLPEIGKVIIQFDDGMSTTVSGDKLSEYLKDKLYSIALTEPVSGGE